MAKQEPMMMKVDDQKYIVFKRSEFYEMMGALALPPYYGETSSGRKEIAGRHWNCAPIADAIKERAEATCLHDAVVIRRQDVFAPPALDAYANAIQVVVEMSKGSSVEGASIAHLREVADYFHDQACKAWDSQRKLPD
jgi:hypothetical protein